MELILTLIGAGKEPTQATEHASEYIEGAGVLPLPFVVLQSEM